MPDLAGQAVGAARDAASGDEAAADAVRHRHERDMAVAELPVQIPLAEGCEIGVILNENRPTEQVPQLLADPQIPPADVTGAKQNAIERHETGKGDAKTLNGGGRRQFVRQSSFTSSFSLEKATAGDLGSGTSPTIMPTRAAVRSRATTLICVRADLGPEKISSLWVESDHDAGAADPAATVSLIELADKFVVEKFTNDVRHRRLGQSEAARDIGPRHVTVLKERPQHPDFVYLACD